MSTPKDDVGRTAGGGSNPVVDVRRQKQPYRSPKLVVYGDIRAITQAIGNMGAIDGGTPPNQRSQL